MKMNQVLYNFHFLQPWWFLALLGLPLVCWLTRRQGAPQRALLRLVDAPLLPHLVRGRGGDRRIALVLMVLTYLLTVLALAGPSWSRVAMPLYGDRNTQIVAISLSRRMLARDVAPSRIERARYKAHDLLRANRGGLNALIAYAGASFVVAPLTSDAHSLSALLDGLNPATMPVDGNNAAQAIKQAVALVRHAKLAVASLILITDSSNQAALAAAREARTAGVHVSVLGMGTPQGAPVALDSGGFLRDAQGKLILVKREDAALAALAAAGGGRYVPMSEDQHDITALSRHWGASHAAANVLAGRGSEVWQDRGPWLLLPCLLLLALGFRRGWLLSLLLLVPLAMPTPVQASMLPAHWQVWWLRPDQQAASALRAGHPKQAAVKARDPQLRGAAAYRAGDYHAAIRALRQAHGSDAAYNLGNALARLGRFPEAIKAYDRAWQINPDNADARVNRKAVKDFIRHQQKKSVGSKPGGNSEKQGGKHQVGKRQAGRNQNGKNQQGNSQSRHKQNIHKQDAAGNKKALSQSRQSNKSTRKGPGSSSRAPSSAQQAARRKRRAKAEKALGKQINQALKAKRGVVHKAGNKPEAVHRLGARDNSDSLSALPDSARQMLQQVPDDPGALLRNKFRLEYQERQQRRQDEDGEP